MRFLKPFVFTERIYRAYLQSVFTERIHRAYSQSVFIERFYGAYLHGVFTNILRTAVSNTNASRSLRLSCAAFRSAMLISRSTISTKSRWPTASVDRADSKMLRWVYRLRSGGANIAWRKGTCLITFQAVGYSDFINPLRECF
jgi:hypothetical protein